MAGLDEAGGRFSLEAGQVDAALLEADLRAIRRQVELWLGRRLSAPEGWTMLASEVGFGPKHRWPAVEIAMPEGPPVAIRGRIDGVERMGGVLRAVEFKSGRGDGYRRRLQQGALETQFQLVVYAAALGRSRACARCLRIAAGVPSGTRSAKSWTSLRVASQSRCRSMTGRRSWARSSAARVRSRRSEKATCSASRACGSSQQSGTSVKASERTRRDGSSRARSTLGPSRRVYSAMSPRRRW